MTMKKGVKYRVGTLLGRPRREKFLERLPKHAVVAEIGVFRGEFSREIVRVAMPRELHLIDGWWELFGERFPDWGHYTDGGRLGTKAAYEEAVAAVDGAPATFHVGDDREILSRFPDAYFDWVYLDSSHDFDQTIEELQLLAPKVKPGGFIAGHDWTEDPENPHHGVSRAVTQFCATSGWHVVALDNMTQWLISAE
jgi:hypothetical protein